MAHWAGIDISAKRILTYNFPTFCYKNWLTIGISICYQWILKANIGLLGRTNYFLSQILK